jgi:hypothetical protein
MIIISRIESVLNDPDPAGNPERAALTLRTTVLSPSVESSGFLRWAYRERAAGSPSQAGGFEV